MDSPAGRLLFALRAARSVVLQAEQRRLSDERQALYDRLFDFQQVTKDDLAGRTKVRIPKTQIEAPRPAPIAAEPARRERRRA